jgi:putative hemolysin
MVNSKGMKLPKKYTTVTKLSKTIALIMFIPLPFIGFVLGMKYQQLLTSIDQAKIPLKNESQYSADDCIKSDWESRQRCLKHNQLQINPSVTPQTTGGIANPASIYCQDQGGKLTIITASDGSQSGQCAFTDGRKCEEWKFFRTKICN